MSFTSGQILTASQLNVFTPGTKIKNANGSASDPTYTFDGDANTGMFRSGTDELGFSTAGSQRLTIQADGQVGIGTTTPFAPLQIFNSTTDTIARIGSGDNGVYISFYDSGSTNETNARMGAYNDALVFLTGGSDRVTIKDDGDVGIGITTPQQRLDVAGDSPRFRLTDTDTTLSDDELSSAIEFFSSDASGTGVAAYIHADGDGSTGNLKLQLGTGTPGGAADRITIDQSTVTSTLDVVPSADSTLDLGTSSLRWAHAHVDRYYVGDSDSYMEFEADSGSGIDGPGIRFVINNSEMFKLARENDESAHAMLTFGETNDGIRYEKDDEQFTFVRNTVDVFQVISGGVFVKQSGHDYFATSPTTGTGNDAEWVATGSGTFLLARNSSLTAEKENITADLGTYLTADMIDQVVPKLWNRLNSPGYPEIGPLAEDMDAISPFLAAHGADIRDGTYQQFLTGINKTSYLSLLVLAVKDLRTRVAALESA